MTAHTVQSTQAAILLLAGVCLAGCGRPSYDLRNTPQQGEVYRDVNTIWIEEGQVEVSSGGRTLQGTARMVFESVTESDLLKVEDGQPLRVKVSCFKLQEQASLKFGDGSVDENTEYNPLTGRSVLFVLEDDAWTGELVGGQATADQRQSVDALGIPWEEDIVPSRPVHLGESWTLAGARLSRRMGIAEENATGQLKMRFEQIVDYNDEPCALLSTQLDLSGEVAGVAAGRLTISGEGHVYRSLANKINLYSRLTGVMRMDLVQTDSDQQVKMTIDGPFVMEATMTKE